MASVEVHGHGARQGDTAFAFCALRFREPLDREGLLGVLRYMAPLIPDPDAFIEELPEGGEWPVSIIGVPWSPPEAGHAVDAQRRLVETAGPVGVVAAWFFQTGTSLPSEDAEVADDEEDDAEIDDESRDDYEVRTEVAGTALSTDATDEGWAADAAWGDYSSDTNPVQLGDVVVEEEELEDAERDADASAAADDGPWTHGPPPQVDRVTFPVDGYPAIVEQLDWEDFGIAMKLAGPMQGGERSVLACFHALWLAPYGGRFRNTDVTIDGRHHAVHLWVDRFAVPSTSEQQVQHLLWIASKIDTVIPLVHARFEGASMAQKYGGSRGDVREPFVLGGNPLLAAHRDGGETAVDAWLGKSSEWSKDEMAAMLRELAIEIVTSGPAEDEDEDDAIEGSGEEVDAELEAAQRDDEEEEKDEVEDAKDADEEDGAVAARAMQPRAIAIYAGEVLLERAREGRLDPRAASKLLPVLERGDKAVVEIMGALRDRAAVPALIGILETAERHDLHLTAAAALGAIADPAAVPALAKLAAAGAHAISAEALASCLSAAPEPHDVDDAVLLALLETIRERSDAETHLAYGRLAGQLRSERRGEAGEMLAEIEPAREDVTARFARDAALALASGSGSPAELRAQLHTCLTSLDFDRDNVVRDLRVALRVAEQMPELIDPVDVVWLTRFVEPAIRARAHALLAKLGYPQPYAPIFDVRAARMLDDAELARVIAEPHVIGRAALIAEAARRKLEAAKAPTIAACDELLARRGGLLDADRDVLAAAVKLLREPPRDDQVISLFDRMLRHTNADAKAELLREPVADPWLAAGYDAARTRDGSDDELN